MSHPGRCLDAEARGRRWRPASTRTPRTGPNAAAQALRPSGAIAWLPTVLAKGPHALRREHLRYRPTKKAEPRLHLIVLDTSGSMRQSGRLALAKGYAARLIEEAARAGDRVALLSFGGQGVQLPVPPSAARAAASARVKQLGGGGGTPLTDCLAQAESMLRRARRNDGVSNGEGAWLWLLTDGRTLEQPPAPQAAGHVVIVDFDHLSPRAIGRCAAWARQWRVEYRPAISPDPLA